MLEPESLGGVAISIFSPEPIFSEDRPTEDLQTTIQIHYDVSAVKNRTAILAGYK